MDHLSLLTGGQEATSGRQAWEEAAAEVLRRTGRLAPEDPDTLVWEALTRRTLDGIGVVPLGTPESVAGLRPAAAPGVAPYTRGNASRGPEDGWDVRAHCADPDAARAADDVVLDLENGATSLWLTLGPGGIAVDDLARVLEGVLLDLAPVALDCPDDPLTAARAFADLAGERALTPHPASVLGVDPVSASVRGHGVPADTAACVADVVVPLAGLAQRLGTRAVTVDATAVHDESAATDAQELGYSVAVGATLLRVLTDAGLTVEDAAALLEFRYAATVEQFPTIAKLRAARRLWHRVLELSGAPSAAGQVQHAVTSRPMLTKYDPWVNMLRGTVAAFAAGVGGAASVTVLPFDSALGIPDALGRRIARNTSSLLVHESHVARVADPAGGAYAVERLTDDLARAGWEELQRIEAEGGVLASLRRESGGLPERMRDVGLRPRRQQIATRRRGVTGVSEFPDLHERLPERRPLPEHAPLADRHALDFELMRDEPAATPVFLATLGTVAQHTARATFAANVLAAGGVDTEVAGPTSSVEDVVAAYRRRPLPVVCLAGTDAAYAEQGGEVVAELREAGASYVVLAGLPGERTVPADVVDDHCAVGVDAVAFLRRVRKELAT